MFEDVSTANLTEANHRVSVLSKKSARVVRGNVREWIFECLKVIQQLSPNSGCTSELKECAAQLSFLLDGPRTFPDEFENIAIDQIHKDAALSLNGVLQDIEDELSIRAKLDPVSEFWSDLHPNVVRVSRKLFEDGHYANSALAALTELNEKVKAYARSTGVLSFDKGEPNGADLMFRAFGIQKDGTAPIVLDELSTESGRNIQDGYAKIFAGAMIGIRNPKAHANIKIDAKRATHFLYLASLLHQVFDDRATQKR